MPPKPKRIVNKALLAEYREKKCLVCNRPSDPCHIKSKGAGGPDVEWNLINLCRMHHAMQHRSSWFRMADKFAVIAWALRMKGWEFDVSVSIPKLYRPKPNE